MADFTSVSGISHNIRKAETILFLFREIYNLSIQVEGILAQYQTDLDFKAEADHLFTTEQLTELNQMISNITALRQNWETKHPDVLTIPILTVPTT